MNLKLLFKQCGNDTNKNDGDWVEFNWEVGYKATNYPAGEVGLLIQKMNTHIPTLSFQENRFIIHVDLYTADDVVMFCGLLRHLYQENNCYIEEIHVGYFPFLRQDKEKVVLKEGEPFVELKLDSLVMDIFMNEIYSIEIKQRIKPKVRMLDPHSDNCIDGNYISVIRPINYFPDAEVIFPDNGAFERYDYYATEDSLVAEKHRDDNGKIDYYKLHGNFNKENDYVVIDDICDGGATFLSLAQALKQDGHTGKLYLQVSHGLFTKGKDELLKYYDEIKSITTMDDNNSFDAVLENAHMYFNRITGNIFDDKKGRFPDGQQVTTSFIKHIDQNKFRTIVLTNNTKYLIIGDIVETEDYNEITNKVPVMSERSKKLYPSLYFK